MLTIQDKQDVLLKTLKETADNVAIFGIDKEVVQPLIKKGLIDRDTFRFTGGCKLTKKGRYIMEVYEQSAKS